LCSSSFMLLRIRGGGEKGEGRWAPTDGGPGDPQKSSSKKRESRNERGASFPASRAFIWSRSRKLVLVETGRGEGGKEGQGRRSREGMKNKGQLRQVRCRLSLEGRTLYKPVHAWVDSMLDSREVGSAMVVVGRRGESRQERREWNERSGGSMTCWRFLLELELAFW